MRKLYSLLLLFFFPAAISFGQKSGLTVFTADLDNFWVAYDSIQTTTDSLKQLHYLQTLYLDKGSPGLKALMETKGYHAAQGVSAIRQYPNFWKSIRPNTQLAKSGANGFEPHLKKLKALYPALKPATSTL